MPTLDGNMTIGQVAKLSGTPATTLRYYEQRLLIDKPLRQGGQRRYGSSVLSRLMVIKFCRIAGLNLGDIATVLADNTAGRVATKQIAEMQLEEIDRQLRELGLARRMMEAASNCACLAVEECACGAMSSVLAELRDQLGPPIE